MSEFNVGDLVYCLTINNKISKITEANEDNDVFLDKAGWFKNTGLNVNGMPFIFHATQENYELLSKLYPNVEFEPPPKRKEPKEIIKAMLDDKWNTVPCYVHNENKTPSNLNRRELILEVRDYRENSFFSDTTIWRYATPFDPKTGKTIIDFVDGEVVLED